MVHTSVRFPPARVLERGRTMSELVGHDDLITTFRTFTHVVADEVEIKYARALLLKRA
jgi:hypothetical protein